METENNRKNLFQIKQWGIQKIIYFPLCILTLGFIIFNFTFLLPQLTKSSIQRETQQIRNTLDVLSEGLTTYLLDFQLSNIYETLDALLKKNSEWGQLELYDSNGKSLYPLEQKTVDKGLKLFTTQIKVKKEVLGELKLYYDFSPLRKEIKKENLYNVFATIFVLSLFFLICGVILQRLILSPVINLKNAAQNLSEGNLEKELPYILAGKEITQLAFGFEIMRKNIKDYRFSLETRNKELKEAKIQLEDINRNLELRVEERTREIKLIQANQIHNEKLASLGEMASGLAHEINNPVAIIDGQLRRLKVSIEEGDVSQEDINNLIEKIAGNLKRVVSIVNGIRKISRDPEGDTIAKLSILELFEEIRTLTKEKYLTSDISIEFIPGEKKLFGLGKETQILQVLFNLIGNSCDAIETQEKKWIKVTSWEDNEGVKIRVRDSGKGIEEAVLEKIFNPFFTTKEIGKGTGIGLSISKGIMNELGGDLFYELFEGNTSFVILLKTAE